MSSSRHVDREALAAGKAAKRRMGRNTDGPAPFGYRTSGGILEVDEIGAAVVRRIFEEAGRHGVGPSRIVRELNQDGIPAPQGGTWSRVTVRRILTNPVYAGEQHGVRKAHAKIVSRQLWNAANEALQARSRPRGD